MSMTKRDYELLARVLHQSLTDWEELAEDKCNKFGADGRRVASDSAQAIRYLVSDLADALRHDNPRFADATFWAAATGQSSSPMSATA